MTTTTTTAAALRAPARAAAVASSRARTRASPARATTARRGVDRSPPQKISPDASSALRRRRSSAATVNRGGLCVTSAGVEPNNRAGKIADPPAPSDGFGVVITGATKGVGFAIAREFLRRGDRVCICGRAQTRVDAAVAALRHEFPGSCVSGMKCDVTDPRDVDAFGDYAASTVGVIHHWLNNAGMVSSRGAFYLTLVPIRPRQRGERPSLRTFPGVSLRPSHAFNPDTPRRLSTPLLTPFNSTPTFARMDPRP